MKYYFLLFWIIVEGHSIAFAQKDKINEMEAYQREILSNRNYTVDTTGKDFSGLILGYQGGNNHYFEAGYGYGVLVSDFLFAGMGPSVEFNLKDKVNGYKLGLWVNSLISLGVNTVLYHNYNRESSYYNKVSFGLRPELGVGVSVFNVTYGYNVQFTNARLSGMNKHLFSLRCMIPFRKK